VTGRAYASPEAFKQALERRLRGPSGAGAQLSRKRQLLVFDRFLARVVGVFGDAVTLKGGLVLEFRLERARTTKDVDRRVVGPPDRLLERLQEAARRLAEIDTPFGPFDECLLPLWRCSDRALTAAATFFGGGERRHASASR
jgi:hypothetical protein